MPILNWVNNAMQTDIQEIEQTPQVQPRTVPFSAISQVKHIQADNVYIKSTFVPAQVKFYTKRTPDNHVAILAHGKILMMIDDNNQTVYQAPANYVIPANSRIAFYTLEDCVFYCVHSTPETNVEVLDKIY